MNHGIPPPELWRFTCYIDENTETDVCMYWLFLSVAAWAGNPCPIDFHLTNLGPLPWAESAPATDPVWDALVAWVGTQECTSIRTSAAKEGRIELGPDSYLDVAALQTSMLIDSRKAYRCEDAHTATLPLRAVVRGGYPSGDLLYQRGSRRVMLTTVGWDTVCVPLADLEDPAKREQAMAAMWKAATHRVVADRHANP